MTRIKRKFTTLIFLLSCLCIVEKAQAALVDDLQDSHRVLLMRHPTHLDMEILLGM
jgi:hypothetical protein